MRMSAGSRIFMDDLIFHKLWYESQFRTDLDADDSEDEVESDVQKLFPNEKAKRRKVDSISKQQPPEWLAVFVGIFFVAGVAGIASYQAYNNTTQSKLSQMQVRFNDMSADSKTSKDYYNEFMLPKNLIPSAYVLYINTNITAKKYNGLVKITVSCKKNTSQLVLHSVKHSITKFEIKSQNSNDEAIKVKDTLRNKEKQMLIVNVDKSFQKGHIYDIFVSFRNVLTYDASNGFYLSEYKDASGKKHTMVSTDFEPMNARAVFPCFDEPALKASFQVILLHQKDGFIAISNMPVAKQISFDKSKLETHFQITPIMSTYLVVFIVAKYDFRESFTKRGLKTRVFADESRLKETRLAVQVAPLIVDYYEQAFGVKFSLPKLDLVPIGSLAAAADETWGANIFVETCLLFDDYSGSVNQLESIVKTIAHEFSHQWFGDLVTMKWWNDLWLKESFANYLEYLPVQKFYPSWDLITAFYSREMASALSFDASKYTHPIQSTAVDPNVIRSTYDAITYEKGSAVVSMLGHHLGQDTFFKGVNIYLNKYAYGNANSTQFWEAMTEASPGVDVVSFMDSWVNEPGFPLINIAYNKNSSVHLSQTYYVYKFTNGSKEFERTVTWHVPVLAKYGGNDTIFKYTLSTNKSAFAAPLALPNEGLPYYKINYGASGYYRVNYDEENWKNLLRVLNTNHTILPTVDRANILGDINSLALSNYHNLSKALDFTTYLSTEHHYVPWSLGTGLLMHIHNVFHHTKLKNCVERYLLKLIKPVINYLNTKKTHSHIQKHLISQMLSYAVSYNDKMIVANLNNIFLKWVVSGSTNKIPGSIRSKVFTVGILYGEKYEFDYMLAYMQKVKSLAEQQLVLSALSMTKDPELLKRYVALASNTSSLHRSTKDDILVDACYNRKSRDMAWNLIKKDFKEIYAANEENPSSIKFMLQACFSSSTTDADLKEAEDFFKLHKLRRYKVIGDRILEGINRNIDFAKREGEAKAWFQKQDPKCLA